MTKPKRNRSSKYAKSKKVKCVIKELPYIKQQYEKKYTKVCDYCGVLYQSANPPRKSVSYCSPKHKMYAYRLAKFKRDFI